jgi:cytochrome P450
LSLLNAVRVGCAASRRFGKALIDPERFSAERVLARPRYAYIPFGAGQRICIGAAFAMTEAMLILAMISATGCTLSLAILSSLKA